MATEVSLSEIVQGLLSPEAYPISERVEKVTLKETHISWLFFTGQFVYKVKKPVNYGFLDFSSLEKRRFYCHEEIRLNRRFSPDVYLDVVEIQQSGDKYFMGTGDNIVDYAVKMKQLPEDRWLSALLEKNLVTPDIMKQIANRIAGFHANAQTNDEITKFGGVKTLRYNTEENFVQTRKFIGSTIPRATYDIIHAYTEVFLDTHKEIFIQRQSEGYIRDCHGDLHKDQICVDNSIEFIDCIEFNERFRYSDVAADLAFLAMDMESVGRPDLSKTLVDSYTAITRDKAIESLLNFYKCYRAYSRGKVLCFLLENPNLAKEKRDSIIREIEDYINLAKEYAELKGPVLIITRGLMGSGKTSLATILSQMLGARLFSSDAVRKELAGIQPETNMQEAWNEGIYSPDSTEHTYATLHRFASAELQKDSIVILDASYLDKKQCKQAYRIAKENRADFFILETICPEKVIKARLLHRQRIGTSISDGRLELFQLQKNRDQDTIEDLDGYHIALDSSKPLQDIAYMALKEIYHLSYKPSSRPTDLARNLR